MFSMATIQLVPVDSSSNATPELPAYPLTRIFPLGANASIPSLPTKDLTSYDETIDLLDTLLSEVEGDTVRAQPIGMTAPIEEDYDTTHRRCGICGCKHHDRPLSDSRADIIQQLPSTQCYYSPRSSELCSLLQSYEKILSQLTDMYGDRFLTAITGYDAIINNAALLEALVHDVDYVVTDMKPKYISYIRARLVLIRAFVQHLTGYLSQRGTPRKQSLGM